MSGAKQSPSFLNLSLACHVLGRLFRVIVSEPNSRGKSNCRYPEMVYGEHSDISYRGRLDIVALAYKTSIPGPPMGNSFSDPVKAMPMILVFP